MKKKKQSNVRTFLLNEDGGTAVEYALLASLLAIMAISGVRALSGGVISLYQTIVNGFTGS